MVQDRFSRLSKFFNNNQPIKSGLLKVQDSDISLPKEEELYTLPHEDYFFLTCRVNMRIQHPQVVFACSMYLIPGIESDLCMKFYWDVIRLAIE